MKDPAPYSLVYSTDLRQDNINYQAETLDISGVTVYLIFNRLWLAIPANVINQIRQGLAATGRTKDWGLDWPAKSVSTASAFVNRNGKFNVSVELLNDKKNVIGKQSVALPYGWQLGVSASGGSLVGITPVKDSAINVTFSGVKADDITDRLNINIADIDGVQAQTASRNKRISIMPIDEYTKNDAVYKTGDKGPAGGIICDKGLSINGGRYVEVAPKESEKELQWNDAISYCRSLNIGGYTDWHLPDYDELNFMYQNLNTKGLGGFSDSWYWSSSKYHANHSWVQRFSDGSQHGSYNINTYSVRSVRAF
jgi:hypothetical protein